MKNPQVPPAETSSAKWNAQDSPKDSRRSFFQIGLSLAVTNGLAQFIGLANSFLIIRNVNTETVGAYVLFLTLMSAFSFAGSLGMLSSREWANGPRERRAEVLARREGLVDFVHVSGVIQGLLFVCAFLYAQDSYGASPASRGLAALFGAGVLALESQAAIGIGILTGQGAVHVLVRSTSARAIVLFSLSVPLAKAFGLLGLAGALLLAQIAHYASIYISTINAIRHSEAPESVLGSRVSGMWNCFCSVAPLLISTVVQGVAASASLTLLRNTLGGMELIAVLGTFERYRIGLIYIPYAVATYSIPFLAKSASSASPEQRRKWFNSAVFVSVIVGIIGIVIMLSIKSQILGAHRLADDRWRMVFTAILLPTPFMIANVLIGSRLIADGAIVVRALIDVGTHCTIYAVTMALISIAPDTAYQSAQGIAFAFAILAMLAYSKWRDASSRSV